MPRVRDRPCCTVQPCSMDRASPHQGGPSGTGRVRRHPCGRFLAASAAAAPVAHPLRQIHRAAAALRSRPERLPVPPPPPPHPRHQPRLPLRPYPLTRAIRATEASRSVDAGGGKVLFAPPHRHAMGHTRGPLRPTMTQSFDLGSSTLASIHAGARTLAKETCGRPRLG